MSFKAQSILFCLAVLTLASSKGSTLKQSPIENFIPFGFENEDEAMVKNDDFSVGPIPISTRFPFFNQSFESVFVNTNGLLTFDRPVSTYSPAPFPLREFSGLSPFWNDIDTTKGGDVFYREVTNSDTLSDIARDIRRAFSQYFNYRPTFAFVVTWVDVAAYSGNSGLKNTFQVIIATNGKHSFSIFNFHKLEWSKADIVDYHAQVGFNAGDGEISYSVEGSLTSDIRSLTNRSNVNYPGKWIFKIENEEIVDGGCNNAGFVTIRPSIVSYVGEQDIEISGPCFNETDQLVLYFKNGTTLDAQNFVTCTLVDRTTSLCRTKLIQVFGSQEVRLVVNGQQTFLGSLIVRDLQDSEKIYGLEPLYAFEDINSTSGMAQISWNSGANSSSPDSYAVVYSLIGENSQQTAYKFLKQNISSSETNTTIDLNIIKLEVQRSRIVFAGVRVIQVIIRVVRTRAAQAAFQAIKTTTVNWIKDSAGEACIGWHREEPDPWPILNSLPPCRPTVPTSFPAIIDGFVQDTACNSGSRGCDFFHPGSFSCYRDISNATSGGFRPGQQCCYDRNGVLKVGPPGGGTLDMVSPDGGFLAAVAHFREDVYTWFICCKLSNNCDLYYEKRPSDDGSRWRPPVISGGSGDPHFLTLDGTGYTFNGQGEYTLLKIDKINFEAQVRLLPYKGEASSQQAEGTVFTAIAVKAANHDSIQLELSESNQVMFYLNGVVLDGFEDGSLPLMGLQVTKSRNDYFIQYSDGISIEVTATPQNDALLIVLTASKEFNGLTKGLLGFMDGSRDNDFLLPSGATVYPDPDNDRLVYREFGKLWQTTNDSSIFTYMDGFEHASYVDGTYTPKFMSDGIRFNNSALEQQAKALCQQNQRCLFDIAATNQVSLGNLSVQFEKQIQENDKNNEIAMQTCVRLNEYFEHGRRTVTDLNPGYQYTAKCDASYCFASDKQAKSITFQCVAGKYDRDLPKCVSCNSALSTKFSVLLLVVSLLTYISFF